MSIWNDYKHEDATPNTITGKLRCVITDVVESVSAKGNPMLTITVRPSGAHFTVRAYLVHNDHFNRNASAFFDAFPEIGDGNFNLLEWPGAMGAAMFAEDERGFTKVKYWLSPEKAKGLPEFAGEIPQRSVVSSLAPDEDENDLPFDFDEE